MLTAIPIQGPALRLLASFVPQQRMPGALPLFPSGRLSLLLLYKIPDLVRAALLGQPKPLLHECSSRRRGAFKVELTPSRTLPGARIPMPRPVGQTPPSWMYRRG